MKKFLGVVFGCLFFTSVASAQNLIVSKLGGKCLDVEGGINIGARLIGFACHGGTNQKFRFDRGRLVVGGYCAQATGRHEGAEIKLAQCNFTPSGDALQNFASWEGKFIGHNTGYVVDLKGGSGHWWGNQPAILWTKKGSPNQIWMKGNMISSASLSASSGTILRAGEMGTFRFSNGQLIGTDGASMVAAGAGNLVAAGGLN